MQVLGETQFTRVVNCNLHKQYFLNLFTMNTSSFISNSSFSSKKSFFRVWYEETIDLIQVRACCSGIKTNCIMCTASFE